MISHLFRSSILILLAIMALVGSTSAAGSADRCSSFMQVRRWGHRVGQIASSPTSGGMRDSNLRLRGGIANMAAYMLCKMGGKEEPTVDDIKAVLGSVDAEVDEERITKVVSELNGKDLDQLIEQGKEMWQKDDRFHAMMTAGVGAGGGGGGGDGDAGGTAGEAGGDAKEEEKKEEEEEDDSMDDDMGFGLFD